MRNKNQLYKNLNIAQLQDSWYLWFSKIKAALIERFITSNAVVWLHRNDARGHPHGSQPLVRLRNLRCLKVESYVLA